MSVRYMILDLIKPNANCGPLIATLLKFPRELSSALEVVLRADWTCLSLVHAHGPSAWDPQGGVHSGQLVGHIGEMPVGISLKLLVKDQNLARNPNPEHWSNQLPGQIPDELMPIMDGLFDYHFRVTRFFGPSKENEDPTKAEGSLTLTLGDPGKNSFDGEPVGVRVTFDWGHWFTGGGYIEPDWLRELP